MKLQSALMTIGGMCITGCSRYHNGGKHEVKTCERTYSVKECAFLTPCARMQYPLPRCRPTKRTLDAKNTTGATEIASSDSTNTISDSQRDIVKVTCRDLVQESFADVTTTHVCSDSARTTTQPSQTAGETTTNHEKILYKLVAWAKKIVVNRDKTAAYIEAVDGTTPMHIPVVVRNTHTHYAQVADIDVGDAITVVASSEKKSSANAQRPNTVRLVVESEELGHSFTLHQSERRSDDTNPVTMNGIYPMTYLRDHCNLRVRNAIMQSTFRIRAKVTERIFSIFSEMGFIHVTTPSLTNVNCEGMGEIFQAVAPNPDEDQEGASTFLSVSGQLELEALCSGISKVWKLGPAFRADRSDTPRHLCEFWMLEAEMNDVTLPELIETIHTVIRRTAAVILSECRDDLTVFDQQCEESVTSRLTVVESSKLNTLTYTNATELLNDLKQQDPSCEHTAVRWGEPLTAAHERSLLKATGQPLLAITHYPTSIMPFYMERLPDGTVNNVDLLANGVGEVAGGSIREVRHDILKSAMQEHNVHGSEYDQYLELRKFGNVTHGGFGIGFERLLMFLLGIQNIRDVIHFPRLRKKHVIE
ncbi:Asparagine--tRNA ligase [Babesia caballi]|uniref:asparagine--tRNA ligase n=1 Tax=Babesia caballi TaxID=5871 RepID=A0AAV4LSY4_BABCB|nr:Asparagine--tRNA ligase [Babesia caballi]